MARALPDQAGGRRCSAGCCSARTRQPNQPTAGFLILSCFDYEVSARVRVRAEVAEPGTVLVPGRLLVEIVRSCRATPSSSATTPTACP